METESFLLKRNENKILLKLLEKGDLNLLKLQEDMDIPYSSVFETVKRLEAEKVVETEKKGNQRGVPRIVRLTRAGRRYAKQLKDIIEGEGEE